MREIRRTLGTLGRGFRDVARSGYYRGNDCYCPVCDRHARKFRAFGNPVRPNARCPHCGAQERHRATWLYLSRHTDLLTGGTRRVLHVAPERGFVEPLRHAVGEGYVTADLAVGRAQLSLDICDNPFRDDYFDAILCSHVLEHVPDDRLAMREFRRVLKPSGWALLQVPLVTAHTMEDPSITDPKERTRLFGQSDHVRRYGADFPERLREAGFEVEVLELDDWCPPEDIERMRLARSTTLHRCSKR